MMKRKLTVVIAAMLALATQTPQANAADLRLIGSGRQLSIPALCDLVQGLQQEDSRRHGRLSSQGKRRGHPGSDQQDGGFRRERRRDDAGGDRQSRERSRSLPMTAGEIVLAYNLPGQPKDLKLPRDVYPDIFLGKITRWNDPAHRGGQPELKLPDLPITVVRRSDSSGTTFVFTKHLSAISPAFKDQVGQARTSSGRGATRSSPPRKMMASPRRSSKLRARLAISNMATPN